MWSTKQRSGARAQFNGSSFENLFEKCCEASQVAITRIPDSCRQLSHRIIRVKSPFDWILTYQGRTALIDTKSTLESTFAHSAIDWEQVKSLYDHEARGAIAGYVLSLGEVNRVVFVGARHLLSKKGVRGSISHADDQVSILGLSGPYGFDATLIFGGRSENLQKKGL